MSAPACVIPEMMRPLDVEQSAPILRRRLANDENDDDAGKGMGIAMFVLIIFGTVSSSHLSLVCFIAATVLASVLRCGCRGAKQ